MSLARPGSFYLLLALLVGCAVRPAPHRGGEPTVVRFSADASRLYDDVRRAIDRSHWGVARHKQFTGVPRTVEATALLPDGREAHIFAKSREDGLVEVWVQVGRLGDPRLQRAYIKTLRETLAGPPKPERDASFEIPPESFLPAAEE